MAGEAGNAADYLETRRDKFVFRVRRGLLYTKGDVWVKLEDQRARVGVTDLLQRTSGDVGLVGFAPVGGDLREGADLAEIETIKTTVVVPAPLAGRLEAVNEALVDRPELVNEDPYGQGWLAVLEVGAQPATQGLLDDEAYFALMKDKLAAEER